MSTQNDQGQSYVIAIDIGGTSYRVALANGKGRIVNRLAEPTRSHESADIGLARIEDTIKKTIIDIEFSNVISIIVCAAGPLDPQEGILLTPPSLPAWRNVPVKKYLEESFGIPVWVENDADLAALGEQRFGAGKGCSRLIYITVSTGIGGGIIVDNQILRGTNLSIAEIGHMVVANGPVCNCGGSGHLESLASGTAIARIARERIADGEASLLSADSGNDISDLSGHAVIEAALEGDALAIDVIRSAGGYLGTAVASLMHLFDPQVVIIGGGISNAGELILEPAREKMDDCSMTDFKGRTRLVRSELGDNSGIMGAIALAIDQIERG